MPDGNRPAHHVHNGLVDVPAVPLLEAFDVREHLRRECLVHLDQAEVLPGDACALKGQRNSEHRSHQQLPAGIDRR